MGTVYRAHDPLLERTVAIKTVACAGLSRQEAEAFEQRFYLEAKSAGRLNHPNIVTIHDIGRSDDLAYIAMEFMTGRTLRDVLDSGLVMPPERSAEIAGAIADGLAFAHANGVVHRDIKPANIMILDNGAVKIADFGVALVPSGSLTVAGTAFGSPKYMAPEQITGQKADGRSDIFSLGVVLYEMLAGRPPFDAAELNAILYQVLNSAPPLPSTYNPKVPQGLDRIVARALAKDPDKRFQDAAEMAVALHKYFSSAKPEREKPFADEASLRATRPGDATVPVATVKAAAATTPFWKTSGLRYAVPLIAVALIIGWLLLRPTELPSVTSVSTPISEPAPAAPAAPSPPLAPISAAPQVPAPNPASSTDVAPLPAEPTEVTPPVQTAGRIRLAIAPWGEVHIDGKLAGITPPLTEIRLPPGKHSIEIRNGSFRP